MYTVRNRADLVCRKHSAGNYAMAHGYAVHIAGEAQRQISHVEGIAFPGFRFIKQTQLGSSKNLRNQAARELIVSGGNRCVRGKNAHVANDIESEFLPTSRETTPNP